MRATPSFLLVALAACHEIMALPPECDPERETCPPGSSTGDSGATTGDELGSASTVHTVTSTGSGMSGSGTSASTEPPAETTSAPAAEPAIVSVSYNPDPLEAVGAIEVDVVAQAEGVRMILPDSAPVELTPGPASHFRGKIEIRTGLSNGTHDATFEPREADVVGVSETYPYTVALHNAGELFLWDTMPDHGLGQIQALRVTATSRIVGFGTIFEDGKPRCFLHRRELDGKYTDGDVRVIFADKECQAVDLVVDGDVLYLLASVMSGDGPRWRLASALWGEEPAVVRTGGKDEVAHAVVRSDGGLLRVCGTGPTTGINLTDKLDARVWPPVGEPSVLDYVANPNDPLPKEHLFDEVLRACAFAGERLVGVGEVFGRHEPKQLPFPPKRKRPLLLELDDPADPTWHVPGLGPGNVTQGSASELAIDDQGRYWVGLYTCGDTCDVQGEVRRYEPGGKLSWTVTLGPNTLPPSALAWSPAGYLTVGSAEAVGNWSSKFLLQAFIPDEYEPAWNFAKAEVASLHVAWAVAVTPKGIVGAGVGGDGFPAMAFLYP